MTLRVVFSVLPIEVPSLKGTTAWTPSRTIRTFIFTFAGQEDWWIGNHSAHEKKRRGVPWNVRDWEKHSVSRKLITRPAHSAIENLYQPVSPTPNQSDSR